MCFPEESQSSIPVFYSSTSAWPPISWYFTYSVSSFHVQCFAADTKNDTAVLQNLSAVSIGNNLDFFPADSDIPEEITVRISQRFARHCRESLCCKPGLFFSSLMKVLACLF